MCGLIAGARGVVPKLVQDFWKQLNLDKYVLTLMALTSSSFSKELLKTILTMLIIKL